MCKQLDFKGRLEGSCISKHKNSCKDSIENPNRPAESPINVPIHYNNQDHIK